MLVLISHSHQAVCNSLSWQSAIGYVACNAGASASTSQSTPFASPPAQSSKRGVPPAVPLAQTALVGIAFPSWKKLAILISAELIGQRKKAMGTKHSGNMGQCCVASAMQ